MIGVPLFNPTFLDWRLPPPVQDLRIGGTEA